MSNAPSPQGRETTGFTASTSLRYLSVAPAQTYGGKIAAAASTWLKRNCLTGLALVFFSFSQSIQAQEIKPIDLRIEIDASIYSSTLCQKLVALHESRDEAPWGLTFAKPSKLCTYPGVMSKPYDLNMWRFLVSELSQGLKFSICRPIPQGERFSEQCTWSLSIKKPRKWREVLTSDDFLFLVVAGLHEQLPVRSFNSRGDDLSRPEPRMKSDRLENPPQLVRGRLAFERKTGRMLFSPFNRSVSGQHENSIQESYVWWLQKEEKTRRISAFEELLQEEGYTLLHRSEPSEQFEAEKSPLPQSADRHSKPAPKPHFDESPLDESSAKSEGLFDELLQHFWNGVWQANTSLSGLLVPESLTDRIPSVATAAITVRHPIWKSLSTGFHAQYGIEKEAAELRVNTSLTGQSQTALGRRSLLMAGGHLDLSFACASFTCRLGTGVGYGHLQSAWDYDREKTTTSVWTPQGRGPYVQPWLSLEPSSPSTEGASAEISILRQNFSTGLGTALTLQGGWIFRPNWTATDWGSLKLTGWQAVLGYRTGELRRTQTSANPETGGQIHLTSMWVGLQAELTEILQ